MPLVALFPPRFQALRAPLVALDDVHQWDGGGSWESMKSRGSPKEAVCQHTVLEIQVELGRGQ